MSLAFWNPKASAQAMQSATQHNQDISRLGVKLIRTPNSELPGSSWFTWFLAFGSLMISFCPVRATGDAPPSAIQGQSELLHLVLSLWQFSIATCFQIKGVTCLAKTDNCLTPCCACTALVCLFHFHRSQSKTVDKPGKAGS